MTTQPPRISLEFFPPRDLAAQERLIRSAKQLAAVQPHYVSVTFGAGGTTRSGTEDTVRVLHRLGYPVSPHLSCVGASRQMLADILHAYRELGIRRIVALRGDLPSGYGASAASGQWIWCALSVSKPATGFILKWPPTPRCTRRPKTPQRIWITSWKKCRPASMRTMAG